ncbi:unnamed protein product [Rotaria sp. Silwood1]|nr:unnamed protein product [Rotaria sp. Silwood1]
MSLSQLDSVYIYPEKREEYVRLFDEFYKIVGIYDNRVELMMSIKDNIKHINKQMEMVSFFDENQYSIRNLSEKSAEFLCQLSKECEKIKNGSEKSIHLYRGTTITIETAETFKANLGKLIATNCYWSTSRDRSYALTFAKRSHNRPDMIPALFKIECDIEDPNNLAIFADISTFSNFPEEQEVLFDVGTLFKIEIVKEEKLEDNDILLVAIKTTGEGQEITANYMEVNRREMQDESPKIMLCNLLKRMGKFEKSLKFLKQLRRNPGDENLAHIHNRIGIALKDEKKYEAALEHFQTAFELAYNSEPSQRKYCAFILHNQGLVYAKQNKLNEALSFQQRALEILESIGNTNAHFVASYYGSIGRICSRQNDFDKAMKYFMEAIKISEMSLSTDHVYNAFTYADIATMYSRQHKYDEALSYHLMALELRKKYLLSNNYNIGWSLQETKVKDNTDDDDDFPFNGLFSPIEKFVLDFDQLFFGFSTTFSIPQEINNENSRPSTNNHHGDENLDSTIEKHDPNGAVPRTFQVH